MRNSRSHTRALESTKLNSIRKLHEVLLNDISSDQLIRHFLLIQIALPIKREDLIQLRWQHLSFDDPSIIVFRRGRENTFSIPCFYPITGDVVIYLNGLRNQHNGDSYVFGQLARIDAKQRNRLISDYIKKSGIRLTLDFKYLHHFFEEYAAKSYFTTQFVTSFLKGERDLACSQKHAKTALLEWWGEKLLIC